MRVAASSLAALAGLHPYKSPDVALVELWQKTAPGSLAGAWRAHCAQRERAQHEREQQAIAQRRTAEVAQAELETAQKVAAQATDDAGAQELAVKASARAAEAQTKAAASEQAAADAKRTPLSVPDLAGTKRKLVAMQGAALEQGLADTLKTTEAALTAQAPDTPAQRQEVQRVLDAVKSEIYTAKGRRDEGAALAREEKNTHRPIGRRNAEFFRHALETPNGTSFELCGYVDGICDDHVVEVKNRMRRLFSSIPEYERVQMHAYMLLAGKKSCRWVQRFCQEQESRMVAWDGAWWDNQVLPPLYAAVERYGQLLTDESEQTALLAAVDGSWAPG